MNTKTVFLYRQDNAIGAASHYSYTGPQDGHKTGYDFLGRAEMYPGGYIHSPFIPQCAGMTEI